MIYNQKNPQDCEKKNREKLRAGINHPTGLLNHVDSSTNALQRTKKLELLKTSGFLLNKQGLNSFENKLEAENYALIQRPIGGHTIEDTLLFEAKVMSSSGFLLPKNFTEIEKTIMDSDSTQVQQNAYVKMIIAGCLNQAKSIIAKYDKVINDKTPKWLVEETHEKIRALYFLVRRIGPNFGRGRW